jgi:hypothetical protein
LGDRALPGGTPCVWRAFLGLAAVDAAAAGGWLAARPGDLLALLGLPTSDDALLLGRLLGLLWLGHAPALVLAAVRRARYGGLVWLPLLGRVLAVGLWLWLLGTDRVQVPRLPLVGLIAHDAVWLPGLLGFLWSVRRECRQGP